MTDSSFFEFLENNAAIVIAVLFVLLGIIVYYYVLLVRAILQMLRHQVSGVLLTFAFLSLVPLPVTVIMGVVIMIIWHYHKKDLQTG